MRTFFFSLIFFAGLQTFSQSPDQGGPLALIPVPVNLTVNAGYFELPNTVKIETPNNKDLTQAAQTLVTHLSVPTGATVTTVNNMPDANIRLVLNKTPEALLGSEGYYLSITPQSILLRANQPAGLFYGIQTLLQLFPKEIESTV